MRKKAAILSKLQGIGDEEHVNLIEELSFIDNSGREQVRSAGSQFLPGMK